VHGLYKWLLSCHRTRPTCCLSAVLLVHLRQQLKQLQSRLASGDDGGGGVVDGALLLGRVAWLLQGRRGAALHRALKPPPQDSASAAAMLARVVG
jgi:hypothetical protein